MGKGARSFSGFGSQSLPNASNRGVVISFHEGRRSPPNLTIRDPVENHWFKQTFESDPHRLTGMTNGIAFPHSRLWNGARCVRTYVSTYASTNQRRPSTLFIHPALSHCCNEGAGSRLRASVQSFIIQRYGLRGHKSGGYTPIYSLIH